MDFTNSCFIIDRNKMHMVVSHEELLKLDIHAYTLLQNFKSHHEATVELSEMLKYSMTTMNKKVDDMKKSH
jgi:hypothetical protein